MINFSSMKTKYLSYYILEYCKEFSSIAKSQYHSWFSANLAYFIRTAV